MRAKSKAVSGMAMLLAASLALPVIAQEKKQTRKKPRKRRRSQQKPRLRKFRVISVLFDTEKNYMIVVTKEGKLVTLDYNAKTKATEIKETKVKMADVGLGSSANVEYVTKGEKNFLTKMEFTPAKGE